MSRRSSTASSPGKGEARCLHIDAFSGMAGNMFMGALLDLGLSRKALEAGLSELPLEHKLVVSRVERGALAARYVDVRVPGQRRRKASKAKRAGHTHGAHHAHDHHHDDEHHLDHNGHGRSYREIVDLLSGTSLDKPVLDRALAIFEQLAHAEAHVHGVKIDTVHFHEVGAVDAIVDVTAAALGLHLLGVTKVTCSPVALGHGSVQTAHGRLPLPAPATLELLKGIPTIPTDVAWETVTPTGAAILRTIVDAYQPLPASTIEAIGYGAGQDRPGPMPNVVRAVLGRESPAIGVDRVTVLETNLDDLVPEHFDHLMERLIDNGALDVSIQHIQMKKNRPGFLVRVLTRPSDRDRLARVLFAESSAIGVRHQEWDRMVLERSVHKVDTPYGRIRVKEIRGVDGGVSFSAEYDDCKRAARKHAVALREIVQVAETAAREFLS